MNTGVHIKQYILCDKASIDQKFYVTVVVEIKFYGHKLYSFEFIRGSSSKLRIYNNYMIVSCLGTQVRLVVQ